MREDCEGEKKTWDALCSNLRVSVVESEQM